MKIVVFGANGPSGRLLCAQALSEGHAVTAVTRRPEQFPLSHELLTVRAGDAYDPGSVAGAVHGHDAVLSTLGVPYSLRAVTLFSRGTRNMVEAMHRHGVRRLVCVSSSGTDPAVRGRDTGGGFLFERILKPALVATLGKTLYADMLRMEQIVAGSGLDWTIVRPGALFDTSATTSYRTAPDHINARYTSRADLADCMLRQLDVASPTTSTIAVATFSPQPSMLSIFWNEALQSLSR